MMAAPVAQISSALAAAFVAMMLTTAAQAGCAGAECYRHVSTPPVYGSVSERVLVRPAETVYRTTPPIYDTVAEQVLVEPGRRVWQTRHDPHGGLVGCWVDIPPRYATRHRRVLVQPGASIPETIPAEYASVHRRVLVEPARSGWVPAPEAGGVGLHGFDGPGNGGVGLHGRPSYRRAGYGHPHRGYGSGYRSAGYGGYGHRNYGHGHRAGLGIGSIPDAVGMTGASSADVGVALGFSTGSIYDGY